MDPLKKLSSAGFTLTEVLIGTILLGMVFVGAISLYTSGLRTANLQVGQDISVGPEITAEQIAAHVKLANQAVIEDSDRTLHLRLDYSCAGDALNSPQDTSTDTFRHYVMEPGSPPRRLLYLCDSSPTTNLTSPGNPAGTVALLSNVDANNPSPRSSFTPGNPSGQGTDTVIQINLVTVNPSQDVQTEVALGAPKR